MHDQVHDNRIHVGEDGVSAASGKLAAGLNALPAFLKGNLFAVLFFVAVWALLVFCEPALLFRAQGSPKCTSRVITHHQVRKSI